MEYIVSICFGALCGVLGASLKEDDDRRWRLVVPIFLLYLVRIALEHA